MADKKEKNKIVKVDQVSIPSEQSNNNLFERIMDSIDKLGERITTAVSEHDRQKAENDERQRAHENSLNKRVMVLAAFIFVVFTLMWFTALIMGKDTIANTVLSVMLASGAGVGIGPHLFKK